MTLAPEFPGDEHELLRRIQGESLDALVLTLYRIVTDHYRQACELVGIQTELGIRLEKIESFPDQPLFEICSAIAAHYRFHHPELAQLTIISDGRSHEQSLCQLWTDHFTSEVKLLATHPRVVQPLLQVMTDWDSARGRLAYKELLDAIDARYGNLEHLARREIQRNLRLLPEDRAARTPREQHQL